MRDWLMWAEREEAVSPEKEFAAFHTFEEGQPETQRPPGDSLVPAGSRIPAMIDNN